MSLALVIAITPLERDRLVVLIKGQARALDETDESLLDMLTAALTEQVTRSVLAELDPAAITEPNAPLTLPRHATTLMGTGKDR